MRKIILASLTIFSMAAAHAAELAAPVRSEIEGLLTTLGSSQCQFYRNGSWHGGREAESHLRMKYDYFVKHASSTNAEAFIDAAATKSSLSGEPYAVKCAGEEQQPSATWLKARLQEQREHPPTKS